jgi:hypothetical protein
MTTFNRLLCDVDEIDKGAYITTVVNFIKPMLLNQSITLEQQQFYTWADFGYTCGFIDGNCRLTNRTGIC